MVGAAEIIIPLNPCLVGVECGWGQCSAEKLLHLVTLSSASSGGTSVGCGLACGARAENSDN